MTEEKLQAEYRELVSSGLCAPLLLQCFCSRLANATSRHFGGNEAAARFLGVHRTTISRWYNEGLELPVSEQLKDTVARIAKALLEDEIQDMDNAVANAPETAETGNASLPTAGAVYRARHIIDVFDTGLVLSAIDKTDGRKGRAATLLGVHRNWVVIHKKVRRFA